jgi:hypothetical protein
MKQSSRNEPRVPAPALDYPQESADVVFEDVVDPLTAFELEAGEVNARPGGEPESSVQLQSAPPTEGHPSEGHSSEGSGSRPWLVFALAAMVVAQAPLVVLWALQSSAPATASAGSVYIETDPPGTELLLERQFMGRTPVRLSLEQGRYTLTLRQGNRDRELAVSVRPGETLHYRVELAEPGPQPPATATSGSLRVITQPPGAAVSIDGVSTGTSPVTLPDTPPGTHTVLVRFQGTIVEERVLVESGGTASLVVTVPRPSGTESGWVTVSTAVPLHIFEHGRLIGTTDAERLMLPPGRHTLELVNDELGFRQQRTITIGPNAPTALRIELPRASLSINAQPWANVWVNGESVGETPIGNLSRPIGRHEVVLRHPSLGERKLSVQLTLKEPTRIGVDFRRTYNQVE